MCTCVKIAQDKLGLEMPAWNPSAQKTKEGGSWLQSKFKASLII